MSYYYALSDVGGRWDVWFGGRLVEAGCDRERAEWLVMTEGETAKLVWPIPLPSAGVAAVARYTVTAVGTPADIWWHEYMMG